MNLKKLLIQKNMKTLFAIDNSGSTYGNRLYYLELEKILNSYWKEGDEIYVWGSNFIKINKSQINFEKMEINSVIGGGTRSEEIAKIAIDAGINYREHLLIVTDGGVWIDSIDESSKILKENNINFKFVTTFIIGQNGNLSVGAPYCRNCPNITYYIEKEDSKIILASLLPEDIKILSKIHNQDFNYEYFKDNYEGINRAIQAKMIGADIDYELIQDLNLLKEKIIKSIPKSELKYFSEKWNELNKMVNGGLKNSFTLNSIYAAKKNYDENQILFNNQNILYSGLPNMPSLYDIVGFLEKSNLNDNQDDIKK